VSVVDDRECDDVMASDGGKTSEAGARARDLERDLVRDCDNGSESSVTEVERERGVDKTGKERFFRGRAGAKRVMFPFLSEFTSDDNSRVGDG
jgi:hypothetical protein